MTDLYSLVESLRLLPSRTAIVQNQTSERSPFSSTVAVLSRSVNKVKWGRTVYQFTSPLYVRVGGSGRGYTIEPFNQLVSGIGHSFIESKRDFEEKFHELYQAVDSSPAALRTDLENQFAVLADQYVNRAHYLANKVVEFKDIGTVISERKPGFKTVRWADGRRETINTRLAVDRFALLKHGQTFEAVVQRRYLDNTFLGMIFVNPISTPYFSKEAREKFWRGVLTSDITT